MECLLNIIILTENNEMAYNEAEKSIISFHNRNDKKVAEEMKTSAIKDL